MDKSNVIICRCEDVSLDDLTRKMEEGYTTFEDLKRILRVGMGPCQANTCTHLIQKELAQFLTQDMSEVNVHKVRPLTLGVTLDQLSRGDDYEE